MEPSFTGYGTPLSVRRAGVYNRVSDDQNGRSKSTGQQDDENREAAEAEGWVIAATYTEPEGASASRFATKVREEWERCRADLDAGKLDVLVMWEASRSARRMAPFVELLDACRERGVLIHVTSHERTYDPRKWRDRKSLLDDGVKAEADSEETSQRVQRDVRERAAAGLPHGRLLYGYRREYEFDEASGKRKLLRQVRREDQAVIVEEVFARFEAGESLYAIAMDLERRDVPVAYRKDPAKRRTPGPPQWDIVRLRQMLANPGYIARRIRAGQVVADAKWPALVTEDVFWACQRRLDENQRRRRMKPGDTRDKWLLSGVARCGVCGAYLRCVPNHTARLVYQCRGRGGDATKGRYCTTIAAAVLEAYVTETVLERLSREDAAELFTADRSAETAAAAAALLAKTQELEELHQLAEEGKLTLSGLARHEPRLVAEIKTLEERARSHVAPVVRDTAGPDAAARWELLSLAQRKELLLNVCDVRLMKTQTMAERTRPRGMLDPEQAARRIVITWKTA
jgi:DNA invertase Pin-like site-specific DNA recombinase